MQDLMKRYEEVKARISELSKKDLNSKEEKAAFNEYRELNIEMGNLEYILDIE